MKKSQVKKSKLKKSKLKKFKLKKSTFIYVCRNGYQMKWVPVGPLEVIFTG